MDLSACTQTFVGQFMDCRFSACVLDQAALDTNLGREMVDCSLVAMNLAGAKLYGKFVRCDFSQAKLIGTVGTSVSFEDCTFDGAELKRAHFLQGTFVRCTGTGAKFGGGSLAGSRIEGGNLFAQDLGDTLLDGVFRS